MSPPHPISSVIVLLTTLLIGDVSGQQPKRAAEPPPPPLLPAEQVWLRTLPALPSAAGALDGDRVYIPLADDGGTMALARETGEAAWTNAFSPVWPLLLARGAVIGVAGQDVTAMSPGTGATLWRLRLPAESIAPAIAAGELVLVALANGALAGIRVADGQLAWSQPIDGLIAPVALATDGVMASATMDGNVVAAVRVASGELIWRGRLDGTLSPPAIGKERVFVGSTSNRFYGLDAATGKVEWTWEPGMIGGDVIGAAVDGDVAYFVGLDNLLHAVNRGNGNQRWKQPTPMRPIAPPEAFGGLVVVFGVSPAIAAFNARTGAAIGTYTIPTAAGATTSPAPKGPPLVDPDLRPFRVAFVVITADGRVIGLRPTGMMFREAPAVPLTQLPGKALPREQLPLVSTRP